MGELAIRRNRGFSVLRYQGVSKGVRTQGSAPATAAKRTTVTVSETLRQLMSRVSQAETHVRESRRTLQTGEGTLAEVQDSLARLSELAKESAQGEDPDRAALQQELEGLTAEIDRMVRSALAGETPLFLDADAALEDGAEALLYAVLGEPPRQESQTLPDWLARGLGEQELMPEQLLTALGLDQNATGPELVAAITNLSLESSSAASRIAALYLGAVIAGDSESALEGLQQLMDQLSQGVPLDEAIAKLTGGEFASLADFQAQFSTGTAPGLEDFLVNLFLTDSPVLEFGVSPLLSLLEGMKAANLDLMMGLLTVLQNSETSQVPDQPQAAEGVQPEGAARAPSPMSVQTMDNVQVMGRDLSAVTFDEAAGVLTVAGDQDVTIFGTGQGEQAVVVAGSGKVTIQNVTVSSLTIAAPQAQVVTAGENEIQELTLAKGTTLTLDGRGLVRLVQVRGGETSLLRLAGGAVIVEGEEGEEGEEPGRLTVPVELAGPVSLYAQTAGGQQTAGKAAFDILWDTLLPGWSHITAMELEGKQAKMALLHGEPARVWLSKGEHGYPIHTLLLRGRDRQGRAQTRYAYLIWNQDTGKFQTLDMYPNPFSVTGGEAGEDWVYEEETHTLHILSSQVTAVAGGAGTDANQVPFSGRIVLADEIGEIELALGGVACRVSAGRAFDLGCSNQVTLMLQSGTRNFFESGAGCAGISLGEGTSLCIDAATSREEEPGSLTAVGSSGGAGIGQDSGAGRDRHSRIEIRGGVITATGNGGGAGIGAGKQSSMGAIAILGGTIACTGETGGAGIGGGLGGSVGEISVRGGVIEATAACHAAAIGAGVQGECGNILITGTAKIVKAVGGDPGADIGACLFGGCGDVQISGGADIGGAQLQTRTGVALNMGESTVTLPQFRLSARALGLDQLSLTTREGAQSAVVTLDADRRWVSQVQAVYRAMYGRLGGSAVRGVQQYIDAAEAPVRDTDAADALLEEMRQSIRLQPAQIIETHNRRAKIDAKRLLR